MEDKSIIKSKTFWFNITMATVAIASEINPELLTALGFAPETHHKIMTITGALVAFVNIYLRSVTNTSVTVKKSVKTDI